MSLIDRAVALPRRVNAAIDGWLTAPESHAAGRMGLFRILYSLFYLWFLSQRDYADTSRAGSAGWSPIVADRFLRSVPSIAIVQTLELLLAFAVVLLLFGYRVRLATAVVLITGFMLEIVRFSFGKVDHDTLFLAVYIPLFMLMGQWGATYSLDAALKRRSAGTPVEAADPSWRFIWPMRVVLLLLSVLYLSAAYWKVFHGTWDSNPSTLNNVIFGGALGTLADGSSISPVVMPLLRLPLLTRLMQMGGLAFESLFFLSLFDRRLRHWFLSLALIFHATNLILLNVSFAPQLIAYLIFVDWQALAARWVAPRIPHRHFEPRSASMWVGGTLAAAAIVALVWVFVPSVRMVTTLGGLVTVDTLWFFVLPFAVLLWLYNSIGLIRSILPRLTRRPLPNG